MFSEEAIQELTAGVGISQAAQAIEKAFDTNNSVVALPGKFQVHNLEQYLLQRRRARGVMTTSAIGDFAKYVESHHEKGASVFVDQASMQAVAVLNLGTPGEPGHTDNLAVFAVEKTAPFIAMMKHADATLTQKVAAEFLEDWADYVSCVDDAGVALAVSKAIAAIRKLTIEASRKMESEEKSLSASRSTFEQVQASSKEPIPVFVDFKCEGYAGLSPRTFRMRLSILTGADVPVITLRVIAMEKHQEEMARELADLTINALKDVVDGYSNQAIPVLLGAYRKS